VLIHPADLADPDACTNAVVDAVARFGRLDALCNIAGIIRMAHTPEMPREHYLQTIAINLNAPWFLSQAAIPHLLETNGAIVNCASSAAMIGEAYAAAYCASKAGLVNMTKALAMEFARKPIRINAVAPGGMITNISQGMTFPSEAEMDLVARYSGLRGQVEVDDVADLIVLLASPAGRSYHGACISIDAGITAG
jgi:NAD(P)-dependent dehydrogenase (short-subunit alcohol dehydrogenase family)